MNYQIRRRRSATGRNLALFAIAGMAGAGLARANQTPGKPDLRARTQQHVSSAIQKIGSGVQDLHLTGGQKKQLHSLLKTNLLKARAIWTSADLNSAEKKESLIALARPAKDVLDPDQHKKAESLRRVAISTAIENMNWATKELNLDVKQQKQLRVIAFDALEKGVQLPPSKDGGPNYAGFQNLAATTQTKIEAVLNDQQEAKWRVMRGVVWAEFAKRADALQAFTG